MNPERGSCLVPCGGDEYAGKSLFICTFETCRKTTPQFYYVIRSIPLSDLLSSSSSETTAELRHVAHLGGNDLSYGGGCGVLGSKIVFASCLKPNSHPSFAFGPSATSDAYVFDTHDVRQGIVKMPGELNGGKHRPSMIDFAGKLYVMSPMEYSTFVSFEVFDPQRGIWSRLPKYPNYADAYNYALAGSKLLVSTLVSDSQQQDFSVCCYDLAVGPKAKWGRLPRMCNGGPLPFTGKGLVVDLPEQCNRMLLFSVEKEEGYKRNKLVVHLVCLDENKEDISEIMEVKLPSDAFPELPDGCHLFHLGGKSMCLVNTCIWEPEYDFERNYTVRGTVIPLRFEFDISKVDKDRKNCFTAEIQPPRIFEYHARADSTKPARTLGCFVL